MDDRSPDKESDDSKEEELPMVTLKKEDKVRVIKGMILLLFFSSIVIYSLIYCNAPNYSANILFTEEINNDSNNNYLNPPFQFYQVDSRRIFGNKIELSLSNLEGTIQLIALFIFSKNRVRMTIKNPNDIQYEIPTNLFESNDIDFTKEGVIQFVSESNIGVHIDTYPFGFRLYRKELNETFFSTIFPQNNDSYFSYDKNFMRISTTLSENHITYGLGYDNTTLKVKEGDYFFWNNWTISQEFNSFLSVPNFISGNPETLNFFASFMFNSSPMRIILKDNILTYELSGGIIDLIIIDGPKPKDITIQLQKTFGLPFLPSLESMNWMGNLIQKEGQIKKEEIEEILQKKMILPMKILWVDEDEINAFENYNQEIFGYNVIRYSGPIIKESSNIFKAIDDSNVCLKYENGTTYIAENYCIVDYYNPNTTLFYKNSKENSNFHYHNLKFQIFSEAKSEFSFTYPFNNTNVTSSTPLSIKFYDNSSMFNTHNIYPLKQTQILHNIAKSKNKRGIIFSQSTFIGSEQYTGKWLGYFPKTWDGLRNAIKQILNFNLLGSANLIHEACGSIPFDNSVITPPELCARWIQLSSVSAYSRVNNIEEINKYEGEYKQSVLNSIHLRQVLSLYLYNMMVRKNIEGGLLIMPIFAFYTNDLVSKKEKSMLFENEIQFMLGPNLMICPVVNEGERKHKTFFPQNEKLYNFYNGELVNNKVERYQEIDSPLDNLLIFARGGFITPLVHLMEFTDEYLENLRTKPIELIIALDDNYESQGKLYIDDGESADSSYYKMDFVSLYDDKNQQLEIIFKKVHETFNIPEGWYPYIKYLKIYGLHNIPSHTSLYIDETKVKDLNEENLMFNTTIQVLTIDFKDEKLLKLTNVISKLILDNITKQ